VVPGGSAIVSLSHESNVSVAAPNDADPYHGHYLAVTENATASASGSGSCPNIFLNHLGHGWGYTRDTLDIEFVIDSDTPYGILPAGWYHLQAQSFAFAGSVDCVGPDYKQTLVGSTRVALALDFRLGSLQLPECTEQFSNLDLEESQPLFLSAAPADEPGVTF